MSRTRTRALRIKRRGEHGIHDGSERIDEIAEPLAVAVDDKGGRGIKDACDILVGVMHWEPTPEIRKY